MTDEQQPMTDEQRLAMEYDLDDVRQERFRQQAKWGQQNHPDGTGPDVALFGFKEPPASWLVARARTTTDEKAAACTLTYLDILLEEVFEAAAEDDPLALRAELVQVAAVAVAWVEKIVRDRAKAAS